ncbi:hypothetical protein BD413DRAFT_615246 [Trametes elegans]|nr:hypothetical protein BD413DRAFT_615246 [Trametes elegans]
MSFFTPLPSTNPGGSALFATGTVVVETATATGLSATASSSSASSTPAISSQFFSIDDGSVHMAFGALVIGMLLAAMCFGAVFMKAISYLQASVDGVKIKAIVAGLVILNLIQTVFTTAAVYTTFVDNFGDLSVFMHGEWSMLIQIAITTFIASVVQSLLVYRIHAVKPNRCLFAGAYLAIFMQFVFSVVSAVQMSYNNYVYTVMSLYLPDIWPMVATFALSTVINAAIVLFGYLWIQRPYEFQTHSARAFVPWAKYWALKSLLTCGVLSFFNAIAVSVLGLSLTWVAITFFLGSLYILSLLLNLSENRQGAAVRSSVSYVGSSETDSKKLRRASTATLTDNSGVWADAVKAHKMYDEEEVTAGQKIGKENEKLERELALGYHTSVSMVSGLWYSC